MVAERFLGVEEKLVLLLLNLLADSGRVPASGTPEPARNASAEGDFESLFAVAAGYSVQPGPPPPVPMGPGLEQPSQPAVTRFDPELPGSGLPALPAQRQAVADDVTPGAAAMPVADGERTVSASTVPTESRSRPGTQPGAELPDAGRRPLQVPQAMHEPVPRDARLQPELPANGPVAKSPDPPGQSVDTYNARPPVPVSIPVDGPKVAPLKTESQPVGMPAANATAEEASKADPVVATGARGAAAEVPVAQRAPGGVVEHPARPMDSLDRKRTTNADGSAAPRVAATPDRSPGGGAAALAAALHNPGSRSPRAVAEEVTASVRPPARATVSSLDQMGQQGLLPESARVRQAAEVMRQWGTRTATAEVTAGEGSTALRHGPAFASSPPAPQAVAASPVSDPGTLSLADSQAAAEQLVQRMLQGQARNLSSVRFQLSPAELGHLEVHLQQQGDRLDVRFTASHPAARDLIESALPNLRALLQDVGVQLADVDVRHESAGRDGRGGHTAAQSDGGQPDGRGRSGGSSAGASSGPESLAEEGSQVGPDGGEVPPAGGIDAYA